MSNYRDFKVKNISNNKNNKAKSKAYIKILLVVVFLVALVSGVSYAFYSMSVGGSKKVEMTAGTFNIQFTDGNVANISKGIPMTDNEGLADNDNITTFSITNTGDIDALYSIALEEVDINSNTMDKKWIKYSLREKDGDWSIPQSLSNGLLLRNNMYLKPNVTVNYELKIWLDYDADNSVQGKKFSAKIVINAIQSNAQLGNTTQPIINIANTSINVIKGDTLYRDPIPYEVVDANKNQIDIGEVVKTYEYFDGETVREVDSVDVNNTGIYYIYYRVTDKDGNTGCTVVSINVCEENNGSVPIITLNGPATVEINKGSKYIDDGAFAVDDEDGELEVITIGEVNTNVVGEYIIKYVAKDSNGNLVSVIKTVRVVDPDDKDGDNDSDNDDKDGFTINVGTIAINNEDTNKVDIPVTVKSSDDNKVKVILKEDSDSPSIEDFNDIEETSDFNEIFNVTSNGTYYIWVLDSKNNMKSKKVIVDIKEEQPKPDSKPICRFSSDKYMTIDPDADNNTIDLICTDEYQEISEEYLNNDDFTIGDSSVVEISEISGYAKVDKGYKYTITLNGLKVGDTTLTLKDGVISNISNKSNDSVSTNVYVRVLEVADEDKNIKMNIGDTKEIVVKNNVGNLNYISSNEDVASIDENGIISTNNVGTATISIIDTVTKSKVEINVNVVKKITVEYIKNGRNVDSIGKLNSENTTCELNSKNPSSCEVTLPEFTTTNGYKTIGWSTNDSDHSGTEIGQKFSVSENTTLYTISSKEGKTYTISWNSNGVVFSKSGTTSCSVDPVYNDEEYAAEYTDSCFVKKPKIESNENVTILGYNTDKSAHEAITNVDDDLELNSSNNKKVYYTISYKNPITYTADFRKNGYAVTSVGNVEDNTCIIEKAWNNETQKTSCNVKTPKVSVLTDYSFVGWNTDKDATDILNYADPDSDDPTVSLINISKDTVFYTITKFDEKTISARFASQGIGVSEISSNIQQCVIPERYNPMHEVEKVCILDKTRVPTIGIARENIDKYEVIGWNEDADATTKSESYTEDGGLALTADTTYYTITKRKATVLTINWDENGAELEGNDEKYIDDETGKKSQCTISEVYNETEENKQASSCSLKAPTIIRDGFIIDGYIESGKEDLEPSFNSGDEIILTNDKSKDVGAFETGNTWKAKTHKTINVIWHTNGAKLKQDEIESENDIISECTIMNTDTACPITAPEIIRSGYNPVGYNTTANANESVWASKERKSVSENQEYYAISYKDVTVDFYYNNNGSVDVIKDTKTLWNNDTYQYSVPEVVTNSKGPRELNYSGVTPNLNTTANVSLPSDIKTNTKYYAIYSGNVDTNFYYYNLHEGGDYENASQEIETVSTNISAVIKEANDSTYTVNNENVNIPSVVLESVGPGSGVLESSVRKYIGLSRNSSSKVIEDSVTTENDKYYAVYKGIWRVTYAIEDSYKDAINDIGATTTSCDVYGLTNGSNYTENGENTEGVEGSCITTLPSITLNKGYKEEKWFDNTTEVGSPDEKYTITGWKVLNPRATINKYIVSYDCTTNGGICHVSGQDEVEYNGLADLSRLGEKEGYDFLGWNTDKDANIGLVEAPRVTNDMTLYAIFRKTTTISLNSKTSVYTGGKIDANNATVEDGNSTDINYTYYTDDKCSTKVSIESGASDKGKAPIDAGTYYVKATTTATNGNEVSSNCVPHTITPKQISVTWDNREYTYNGSKQVPSYTTTDAVDGETVSYTLSEANNKNQIDANGVDENYTAKLSIKNVSGGREKTSNYHLANSTKNYVINPAIGGVALETENGRIVYGTDTKTFSISGHHGGELSAVEVENSEGQKQGVSVSINRDNGIVTISNLSNLSAGTEVKIKVTSLATKNYTSGYKIYTLIIDMASATCPTTITSYDGVYDGKAHSISVSGYTGGKIQYSTDGGTTWSDEKPTRTLAGETMVMLRVYGDSNHNNLLCNRARINITEANNPIKVEPVSEIVYGSTANMVTTKDAVATVYYRVGEALTSDNYTSGSTTIPTATNKDANDEYKVYYYALGSANRYKAASGFVKVKISKANSINPTLTKYEKEYDGKAHSITVTGGSGGTIYYSTDNNTWSTTKPTYTNFTNGAKTIYVKVVGDANHNDTGVISSTVNIKKKTPTVNIAATNKQLTYGATDELLTADVTDGVTVYYKLNSVLNSTNYTSGSTTIPTATNLAGDGEVYYYVYGGQNYSDVSGNVKYSILKASNPTIISRLNQIYGNGYPLVYTNNVKGTIYYSVDNAIDSSNYKSKGSTVLPTTCISGHPYTSNCEFRNAGKHIIFYYVDGGSKYKDKFGSIEVVINKADNPLLVSAKTGLKQGSESNLVTTSKQQGSVYYSIVRSGTQAQVLNKSNYTEGTTEIPKTYEISSHYSKQFRPSGDYTICYYTPGNNNYNEKGGCLTASITRNNGNVTLEKTSDSIAYGKSSYSFKVTSHHGGTLSASSNNSSASVSVSGNTVTISNLTRISQGTTITITVTSGVTDECFAASSTFKLTINSITRTARFQANSASGVNSVAYASKSCTTSGTAITCAVHTPKTSRKSGYSFNYWEYDGYRTSTEEGDVAIGASVLFTAYGKDTQAPKIAYNSSTSTTGTINVSKASATLTYYFKVSDNSNSFTKNPNQARYAAYIGGRYFSYGTIDKYSDAYNSEIYYAQVSVPAASEYSGDVSIMIYGGSFSDAAGNINEAKSFNVGTTIVSGAGYY